VSGFNTCCVEHLLATPRTDEEHIMTFAAYDHGGRRRRRRRRRRHDTTTTTTTTTNTKSKSSDH
jgi:hypothetical protein